ncbi:RNA guanine-N7 methyltransferase activating subunit-like [Pseudorasbora parva]|uniref:RNA guanine-N7 methyltransferase activating subunit-like n=1 Tax=Pseudorasbora parva TaxID=51549 RepID=UPI00351E45C0
MSRAADYDALFATRFSSEDAEFQRYRERAPDVPPVVEDWRAARGRRDRRPPERHHEHERRARHFPERRDDRNSYGSHGQRSHY